MHASPPVCPTIQPGRRQGPRYEPRGSHILKCVQPQASESQRHAACWQANTPCRDPVALAGGVYAADRAALCSRLPLGSSLQEPDFRLLC